MGIVMPVYRSLGLISWIHIFARFGVLCLSISVSLNFLLTFMIVAQLVQDGRSTRVVASPAGINRFYTAISTILIESRTLFPGNSLVVIGPLVTGHYAADTFLFILADTLVRPIPLPQSELETNVRTGQTGYRTTADSISRRHRSALTSDTIVTGHASSFNIRTRVQSTGSNHNPLGRNPMRSTEKYGNKSGELGGAVETMIDSHQDSRADLRVFRIRYFLSSPFLTLVVPSPHPSDSSSVSGCFSVLFTFQAIRLSLDPLPIRTRIMCTINPRF